MVVLRIILGIGEIIGLAFLLTVSFLAPLLAGLLLVAALVVALQMLVLGRERALAKGTLGGVLLGQARRLWVLSWFFMLLLLGIVALVAVAAWYLLPALASNPL